MTTQTTLDELVRLCGKRDLRPILRALEGELSVYAVDGSFTPHHMGDPRGTAGAFDGSAFLNGAIAIPFLASRLPVGDAVRTRLPQLYVAMKQRLANPRLLLYGGSPTLAGTDEALTAQGRGAWVVERGYVYIRPAQVVDEAQRTFLRAACQLHWPNDPFPWSGLYLALEAFQGFDALVARIEHTPLEPGQWEADPRASAPHLVEQVQARYGLSEASATLFLQLLTLVDCGDAVLCEVNGWSKAQLEAAAAPLAEAGLLARKKQPRATRRYVLPGTWDALKPPHPAGERWKLPLYAATMRGKDLVAPLGRLLPLRPLHELFAAALERHLAETTAEDVPATATTAAHDWLGAIRSAPDDDRPRLIYADWLLEQGDARGELIRVQCELSTARTAELEAREKALLEAHEERWLEGVHNFIEDHRWTRGFITEVTAHAPTFAKGAEQVFAALPMLEGFVFSGSISAAQVRALATCPQFARFKSLDTSCENYFSRLELLEALLASPHVPALERLRLGFHRPGEGLGVELARVLAGCEPLKRSLRFLELQGQNLGRTPMNEALGIEALEVLLEGLPALQTLRVPYNGYRDAEARAITERFKAGLGPALHCLDFSNAIDTDFVTKVVQFHRNRVSPAAQHGVDAVLAARRGAAPPARPKVSPAQARPQQGKFPFAERAKSGRSKCVVCNQQIAADTLRIGVERHLPDVGLITAWVHPACRTTCPELAALEDLEQRLVANSHGAWKEAR